MATGTRAQVMRKSLGVAGVRSLHLVEIRDLTIAETGASAGVLGRGMRENPIHVRAFGPRPDRREGAITQMFEGLLRLDVSKGAILGAFSAGTRWACARWASAIDASPPSWRSSSCCRRSWVAVASPAPLESCAGSRAGPATPAEAHWHLGPVGIERHLQGQGIGSALLQVFCDRVDGLRALATWKPTSRRTSVSMSAPAFAYAVRDRCSGCPADGPTGSRLSRDTPRRLTRPCSRRAGGRERRGGF